MQSLVSKLAEKLISQKLKVVTVESCTAGLIAKTLTDKSGSSAWFSGGLITYSNESKTRLAQVPKELIESNGAVSKEVVEAMSLGAFNHFENCISVAVSGVAGPDGGSEDKPVGTVWIATRLAQKVNSQRYLFKGDRIRVREQTVKMALIMLLDMLEKN